MELTVIWKDILAELKDRRGGSYETNEKDKNRILRNRENVLTRQSTAIVQSIGQLRDLLGDSRTAYMTGGGLGRSGMSETDMDQLDASADDVCIKCTELIQEFNKNVVACNMSASGREHFECVGLGLANYLKQVISIHSEMRAVRVKKQVQLKNLTKLELNSRESRAHEITPRSNASSALDLQEKAVTAAALAKTSTGVWESSDEEEELTSAEAQQMELENERLVEHLSSLNSQVDQVTSKVVKISELQEIFSEKILQQSADIEHIHTQTVNTTENVKEGNEAVRQAIQNQASYRVIILFILLVFSFSLLFLDWYND